MTWVRFDDLFPLHRKVAPLDDAAFRLATEAVFWCSRNMTDGRIGADDLASLSRRATRPRIAKLVERGVWHEASHECDSLNCPEPGPDGWVIHDYLAYQPGRDKVEKDRAGKVARQHRWLAKQRGETYDDIDPLVVYQRDGWICWICKGPVKRGARDGDQKGPSIDHVKPTIAGGTHTYDNVRCAHVRCNKSKGGRWEDASSDTSNDEAEDASNDAPPYPTPSRPAPKGRGAGPPPSRLAAAGSAARPGDEPTPTTSASPKCPRCMNPVGSNFHQRVCLPSEENPSA